jgi:hypothetical protein
MSNRLFVVIAAAVFTVLVLGSATLAAPERPLRFPVENQTGQALQSVEISHHAGLDWRVVTLNRTPIAPGARGMAKVDPPDPECQYDVRAQFVGGVLSETDGVNLCAGALVLH